MAQQSLSESILQFMEDPSIPEFSFTRGASAYRLIRSRYDAETDFFYLAKEGVLGGYAEMAGIYSRTRRALYAPCHELSFLETPAENSLDAVLEDVAQQAAEAVRAMAEPSGFPETAAAKDVPCDRAYFCKHLLEDKAFQAFMLRKSPAFSVSVRLKGDDTAACIRAINHPQAFVQELAQAYVLTHAKALNQQLWALSMIRERAAQLEATPGEHHLRRRILESVQGIQAQSVTLLLDRDGVCISCKIDPSALTDPSTLNIGLFYMPKGDAAKVRAAYGIGYILSPKDILCITYARKTLYERTPSAV